MTKRRPKIAAKAALAGPMRPEDLGPILFLIGSEVVPDPGVWELDLPGRALLVSVGSYEEAVETQRHLRRRLFPALPSSIGGYLRATQAMRLLRDVAPGVLEKLPRTTPRSVADMVPSSVGEEDEDLKAFVKRFAALVERAPGALTMNQAVYLALLAANGVERASGILEGLRSLDKVVLGSGNWRAAQEMRPIAEGREARVTLRIRMSEDGEPEVEMHAVFPPGWGPDRRAEALRAAARSLLQEAERVDARTE
jgi:hypothetical protein